MKCKRCDKEYEPQYWKVLGQKMLRGAGYCPKCAKAICQEEEARIERAKETEIDSIRREHISLSGIPPKFQTATFKVCDKGWQDKALAYCQKYADSLPVNARPVKYPSLYLWSQNSYGVGKTHLSCAIALSIFYRWNGEGRSCPRIYFVSESDLFRQIQATYSFNREEGRTRDSEDDILRKLINCDLLILDDVGKERRVDSRFVQRTLFGLIDGRYKLQLPIVLTANVNADGLKAHLEGASFDRVWELIQGKSVCMDGKSYRRERG